MKYRGGEYYAINSRTFLRCLDLILHTMEKYLIPQESLVDINLTTKNDSNNNINEDDTKKYNQINKNNNDDTIINQQSNKYSESIVVLNSPLKTGDDSTKNKNDKIEKIEMNQNNERIIYSRRDINSLNNLNQTSKLFQNIWNSEKMCSGGIGRGSLSLNRKYKPNRGNVPVDKNDKVVIPRSVGELSYRTKNQNLKTRFGKLKSASIIRSLSPVERQNIAFVNDSNNLNNSLNVNEIPNVNHKNVLVTFDDNISTEKFESILNKIIENEDGN